MVARPGMSPPSQEAQSVVPESMQNHRPPRLVRITFFLPTRKASSIEDWYLLLASLSVWLLRGGMGGAGYRVGFELAWMWWGRVEWGWSDVVQFGIFTSARKIDVDRLRTMYPSESGYIPCLLNEGPPRKMNGKVMVESSFSTL